MALKWYSVFNSFYGVSAGTALDIVTANPSVCPSVRHCLVLYRSAHVVYRQTFRRLVGAWLKFFERYRRCKIPRTHSARALNMRGLGKIATFVRNLRLFRKRYEIGPWLPWITNRKSLVADRSDFSSSDLEWPWKWNAMGQIFWRLSIITLVRFDPQWPILA